MLHCKSSKSLLLPNIFNEHLSNKVSYLFCNLIEKASEAFRNLERCWSLGFWMLLLLLLSCVPFQCRLQGQFAANAAVTHFQLKQNSISLDSHWIGFFTGFSSLWLDQTRVHWILLSTSESEIFYNFYLNVSLIWKR